MIISNDQFSKGAFTGTSTSKMENIENRVAWLEWQLVNVRLTANTQPFFYTSIAFSLFRFPFSVASLLQILTLKIYLLVIACSIYFVDKGGDSRIEVRDVG
jgi:hypothetical protein